MPDSSSTTHGNQSQLTVSAELSLPLDILTQSTAVLAKKRAGKTNLGVVIVEEAYAAGVPVVVIDPKGDWYGIRAAADGSPKGGLPLPVFGGLHGDVPLEPTAGPYLADLVRERGLSCLLDVSEFATDAERRRFLTAFADRIYKHPSRDPMLLMLEEAHEYIPQMVGKDDAKMVGVFSRLVRLGGYKGLGVMMLSQRSASLNKNVLSQVDNMFMLRTGSPQDRAAVQAWMSGHGEAKGIVDSLPGLSTGEFWLWQPERGEPVKARARMRHTYDAGATPKIGETPRPPATLADVDLGAIATAMAATIEKAKADDPKELRRLLHEQQNAVAKLTRERDDLTRQLAARPEPEVKRIEVPILADDTRQLIVELTEQLHTTLLFVDPSFTKPPLAAHTEQRALPAAPVIPAAVATAALPAEQLPGELKLGKAHRAILTVLAQRGTSTRKNIATLAGYSYTSGGFNNTFSQMKTAGYLEGDHKTAWTITDPGLTALGDFDQLPEGRALVDYWLAKFGKAERAILSSLVDAWPATLTRDQVAEMNGYSSTSGGFNNSISKLRALDIISGTRDALLVNDLLGEAGGGKS